jgi:hypothetical protein
MRRRVVVLYLSVGFRWLDSTSFAHTGAVSPAHNLLKDFLLSVRTVQIREDFFVQFG